MTPNQARCLEFIKSYIHSHGLSPTIGEISNGMGFSSRTGSAGLIDKLETEGHIFRRDGTARNIHIKDKSESPLKIAARNLIESKIGEVLRGNGSAVLIQTSAFNALKAALNA